MAPALLKSVFLFDLPNGFEWIIIIAVFLLLFGGKKIPELMRGLGRGIREFNDAKDNVKKEIEDGMKEERKPSSSNSTTTATSQEQAHS